MQGNYLLFSKSDLSRRCFVGRIFDILLPGVVSLGLLSCYNDWAELDGFFMQQFDKRL